MIIFILFNLQTLCCVWQTLRSLFITLFVTSYAQCYKNNFLLKITPERYRLNLPLNRTLFSHKYQTNQIIVHCECSKRSWSKLLPSVWTFKCMWYKLNRANFPLKYCTIFSMLFLDNILNNRRSRGYALVYTIKIDFKNTVMVSILF